MTKSKKLDPTQIHFIPLGGSEEFGVNFNLYTTEDKWLAVDLGIGFADWRLPGVDLTLPDPTFLVERKKDLEALIITHAHFDHIGAVAHLWPRLRCPIYCTAFTAAFLRNQMEEFPVLREAEINIVKAGGSITCGPFTVQFVHVAHSIPDAVSLIIETKAGRVVHSGDWNLDPAPVIDGPTDEAALKAAGKKGVLAYIGDSTNAEVPGRAGSETEAQKGLAALLKECSGRVAIAQFSSNVGRLHSIALAAESCGRKVVVAGRSLQNIVRMAQECGYLKDVPSFIDLRAAKKLSKDEVLYVMTGSQGEARAALSKVSRGEYRDIKLSKGDTVIFSSRKIPGNERDIIDVKNNLVASGVKVITPRDTEHCIHVSGHPYSEEIADMISFVKPKTVVAVHGEIPMLKAQEEIARAQGVKNVVTPVNGSVVRLGPDKPAIIDHVEIGLLAVEPKRIIPVDHKGLVERRKLQFVGAVHVSLVLDERGDLLDDPQMTLLGLSDPDWQPDMNQEDDLYAAIEDILADMERKDRRDDHAVHEEIRIGLRRLVQALFGLRAKVTVHLMRV